MPSPASAESVERVVLYLHGFASGPDSYKGRAFEDYLATRGYSVRRLEDCLGVIGSDLQSTTAMMESRLLAGSRPLYQHFHETYYLALRGRGRRWFRSR